MKYEYPSYIVLQQGEIMSFGIDDALLNHFGPEKSLTITSRVFETFKAIKPTERYYVTDSFREAIEKSLPKLHELLKNQQSLASINLDEPKLFMHKNGFAMHRLIEIEGKKWFHLSIHSKSALCGYGVIEYDAAINNAKYKSFGFLATNEPGSGVDIFYEFWYSYIYLLLFLQECEVETIVVQPEKKLKYESKKYFNDLKTPIKFLDCRWFRELVINTPFGVSGHFRWQPCGEGLKKRKLIWIEAYEKKGYHRKAQVETLNPNV